MAVEGADDMKKPHGNTGRRKLVKKSAYLHIRIDPSLKTMAALQAVSDGLTLSEYIAMLIRKDLSVGAK
jgi:predicted HicB family RNase H-like nuclease